MPHLLSRPVSGPLRSQTFQRRRPLWRLGLAALPLTLLAVSCGDSVTGAQVYRDPLTFGRTSLPAAYQGEAYDASLDLRGGTGPYGAKLSSGALPEGLALKNLRLTGTPTKTGSFRFTVEASDANLSSKVQEYTLNVGAVPPLKLSLQLPTTEIRGATRIPLNITAPRTARAARVTWTLPAGAQVTRVQGGPSSGLLKWNQQGQTLTLDLGFKATPRSGEQVALIHVTPARPLSLDDKGLQFQVLDGAGKDLTAAPASEQGTGAGSRPGFPPRPGAAGASSAATASGAAASGASASGASSASAAATGPAGFPARPGTP